MRIKSFSSMVGKIAMALDFASAIGGMFIAPAFGRDDRRGGHEERGRYEHGRRGYHPRTYYAAPVYAPPPVVYAPAPSPGISLVFPIHIR